MQGRGARAEGDCIFRSDPLSQCFFEFGDFGSGGQPIGAQHIGDGLNVFFGNRLAAVRKQRLAHGSSPVNGEHFLACRCRAHVIYALLGSKNHSGSNL